jgi:hypothetical protein
MSKLNVIKDHVIYLDIKNEAWPFVIVFAPMLEFLNDTKELPWGVSFLNSLGLNINIIAVSPYKKETWYRSEILIDNLAILGSYLNDKYAIGYGWSMGGYGVSAYSDLLNLNNVLLINPVSTLSNELAPFEQSPRFDKFKSFNWKSNYHDGAESHCEGYVIYDHSSFLDRMHALRYSNLIKLKFTACEHNIAPIIHTKVLRWLIKVIVADNNINISTYYKISRTRRSHPYYYEVMKRKTLSNVKRREVVISHEQKQHFIPYRQLDECIAVIKECVTYLDDVEPDVSLRAREVLRKLRPNEQF